MNAATQGELIRTLPYARRYARALVGSQAKGDELVKRALVAGLPAEVPGRLALYAGVSRIADGAAGQPISTRQRQILLLTGLEDLPLEDAATAVGVSLDDARAEAESAREALRAVSSVDVMVIEDEPIIAMDIRQLVESCGHNVVGMASDEGEAVEMALRLKPGLILADVNLGPGGDGIAAVDRILQSYRTPVIFVTAYPERLLTAERSEPAFVISKPFEPLKLQIATYQAVWGSAPAL